MRVTAVPAQVTTVEDHIVGNIGLAQMILLCIPLFIGGLLFAVLPPVMHITAYKLSLIVLVTSVCGIMAIRIKGKIVLFWISILLCYYLRPRYYVFDKHSMHGRKQYRSTPIVVEEKTTKIPERVRKATSLSIKDVAKVKELIDNPAANLAFETRKGGLYVRITEVKQEG